MRVQTIKKPSQPIFFAKKPVGAEATTRGTPMRLERSAYCVAVNLLFVMLAINATYAAVPMPPLRFSKAITPERAGILWPILARAANHAVDIAWRNPKIQRERVIPRRIMMTPPIRLPAMVAQNPKSFTTVPISVFENPISR